MHPDSFYDKKLPAEFRIEDFYSTIKKNAELEAIQQIFFCLDSTALTVLRWLCGEKLSGGGVVPNQLKCQTKDQKIERLLIKLSAYMMHYATVAHFVIFCCWCGSEHVRKPWSIDITLKTT